MGKGGGGGGQPTQTTSNVTNTNVPEYARPYVENMLGATQQQLFKMNGNQITGFQPYKAYGGTYDAAGNQIAYDPSKSIAGFSPLQQKAMGMANGPEGFAQNVGGYMSPYMQNVVDIQKREAMRQSGIQGAQQQAQAAQVGAFGGSRDAIMRAERERNLGQQMNDIQAQGLQAAFANAQNQFNTNLGQMTAAGALQQQNQQQIINQAMQDYANAQQYPLMQLGTMSNMLRGLPMQAQTTQQYQAQANPITQGIGAIGTLGSLAQMKAEGGAVKSMASGGITSIPRYDVGGSVISQLATMPDEALRKEAMESPSPRVREMAAAILKQRQAGMNAGPQTEMAPSQGVGPMGVDYNANYAGGGIIAFADGKKVNAEEAARLANQTKMYIEGARLAAEQRTAEEQAKAAAQPASKGIPLLLNRNAPAYTGSERQPDESFEQFRQRTIQAQAAAQAQAQAQQAAAQAQAQANAQGQAEQERLAELAKRREAGQIPRSIFTTPHDVGSARRKNLSQEEMRAIEGTENSGSFKPYVTPENSGSFKPYVTPENSGSFKPYVAPAPASAAPAVVRAPSRGIVTPAPKASMDAGIRQASDGIARAVPTVPEVVPEAAPAGITSATAPAAPAVDPLADIKAAAKNAQDAANKSQEDIYKENQAALKAQGLDTSEARDQYLKAQLAQRANTEKDFQNREYLRRAEFFAAWGSTPGNTLVAGMTALKKTIPDMIQDSTEKRTALQQADKVIYELGEAARLEKLGQWEKAAAQKLKAAEIAAELQGKLTTATATIEAHKISAKGSTDAANIHATSSEKIQGMRDVIDKLKIESEAATNRQTAAIAAQARHDSMTAQSDAKKQALYQGAQNNAALVESRIDNIMKSDAYNQLRQTANMEPSDSNKKLIAGAKAALKDYNDSFAKQRKTADDALRAAESQVGITRSDDTVSAPVVDPDALAWAKDPKNANDPRLPAIKAKLGIK